MIQIRNGFTKISFNTQPPEGGWSCSMSINTTDTARFNTQPPEGGWVTSAEPFVFAIVSTHSRLKAAGIRRIGANVLARSFNTQPPEGGWGPS